MPNQPEITPVPDQPIQVPEQPVQPSQPSPNEDQNLSGHESEINTTRPDNTEVDLDTSKTKTYDNDGKPLQ